MRGKIIYFSLIIIEIFSIFLSVTAAHDYNNAIIYSVILILTVILYFILLRPISAIEDGMNLLRGQDYASRLHNVGQAEADNIVGLFNDLMDRLKNERLTIEEKNYFLDQLIQASQQGILIMDYDGKNIISSNPAADEIMKTIELPDINDGQSAIIRTNQGNAYKVTRQSFIDKGFHRPFYMIESLTDELRKAQRDAYGKIIRIIAHEVNNTVGGIDSVMQTVGEESGGWISDAMECCRESTKNLTSFISSYTDLVKLPMPQPISISLAKSIEPMKAIIEAFAQRQGVAIEYHLTDTDEVSLDPILWQQVVINVVKNGVESIISTGRSDGKIIISTFGGHSLHITDNGAGIDDDTSQHLFTPFYTTKSSGQGIGLALVSEILQRHGCKYSLSTSNASTTFSISFPTNSK